MRLIIKKKKKNKEQVNHNKIIGFYTQEIVQ